MALECRLAKNPALGGIYRGKCAACKADVDSSGRCIVPNVVRIVAEANRCARPVIVRADEPHAVALTVGNSNALRIGHDGNALRLPKPWQASYPPSALDVDHFDGVVAERGDVQPLCGKIERKVIDASFDARKIDR